MSILTGNMLKIIAAVTMLLDHMGLLLFPDALWMRIVGRLAFPIYAYMIAEGCKYTRNRTRYFGLIAILATLYQIVYYLFDGSLYFSILVAFSLSILAIYALDAVKSDPRPVSFWLLWLTLLGIWVLNRLFTIDYGFWGCMAPVFCALPTKTDYDRKSIRLILLTVTLLLLSLDMGNIQYYSLLAVPVLFLYSGKRGKWNMKYFFYIFYPVHLVVLQAIAIFR